MRKLIAVVGSVAVLSFAATNAAAEDAYAARRTAGSGDLSTEAGGPGLDTHAAGDLAAPAVTPRELTDADQEAFEKLAAEHPELADQAGGYISQEEWILIILAVILLIIIL
ncbi:MAG: hypothetical protein ACYTFI_09215 [Planctomycetota bacterium]|jgi:hypothetical protein